MMSRFRESVKNPQKTVPSIYDNDIVFPTFAKILKHN